MIVIRALGLISLGIFYILVNYFLRLILKSRGMSCQTKRGLFQRNLLRKRVHIPHAVD